MMSLGTFYGVGLGPGDPELLTLKAARVLREVDVVFVSSQARSGRSLALEIAEPHLPPGSRPVPLPFTHTFEGVEDRRAHRENGARVLEVLRRPASCAFLTLGDPMTYSTFTYLLEVVREAEPAAPVEVVPGITSYSAAAAAALLPLAEGDETIAVVSAAQGTESLERALELSDNVVVMKSDRRAEEVCELLEARGLAGASVFSAECSRPGGVLLRDLRAVRELGPRYMSLFLVKRGARP
ncbi:MAG: precorrin-2 C(20)-methyltransferase [Deltaproteobacteria bacterium]|nr:precorrin-2 C(20)-methyltransferase [Deltaproteobacteria bacterium]